jgi:hypothetical protein
MFCKDHIDNYGVSNVATFIIGSDPCVGGVNESPAPPSRKESNETSKKDD